MNRRALLRLVAILPVGAIGAKLGIDTAPSGAFTEAELQRAYDTTKLAAAARSAGVVSIETVMGHFGLTDADKRWYMATLLERTKVLDYTIFDRREDLPFVMPRITRFRQLP